MATTSTQSRPVDRTLDREYSGAAVGLTATAGVLMVLIGFFHVIQGIVALANDTFYVVGKEYVFEFDVTTWGWIHLIAGVVVAIAGFGLFTGSGFARTVAVVVASLSILASFAWAPFYPVWSVMVIAFDVFVIWAVTAHGRDITRA